MSNGHFRAYVEKDFGEEAMKMILAANKIIEEYERAGYSLTLRQLYYQFVARGLLANADANYKKLGTLVSDGRLAGLISWTAIEDRTRNLRGINTLESPAEAVRVARESYAIDLWHNQDWRPEVWIEKEALVGVIGGICAKLRVDFFACRGYNSQSEQWRAGQRFARYIQKGQRPIVFHLGDHDPSGIDMTRDNRDRLSLFAGQPVTVIRLALNMPQIEQYGPPPNPAKLSDSRAADYIRQYGDSSWELDALSPDVISKLIESAILRLRDPAKWEEALDEEDADKETLQTVIEEMGS